MIQLHYISQWLYGISLSVFFSRTTGGHGRLFSFVLKPAEDLLHKALLSKLFNSLSHTITTKHVIFSKCVFRKFDDAILTLWPIILSIKIERPYLIHKGIPE